MYIVQKNHLRSNSDVYNTLKWLSHKCKNLYNSALYTIRTHYDATGHYLSEKELFREIKSHITYKQLHSDNAQLTLRTLKNNFSSFYKLLELQKAGKYTEKVNIPHYLPPDGYFVAQFIKRQMKRNGDQLRLSLGKRGEQSMGIRYIWVTIPSNIRNRLINMVRIVPRYNGDYFEIEFVYDPEIKLLELDYTQYLSLDLGLNNFATAVSTIETAFIIEGRGLKSYNQWWNKTKADLQSTYDKQGIKWGDQMFHLHVKRYNIMRNFIAHTVNHILNHCLGNKIGNLVVGDWEDMKRGLKMRKKTAQAFQQIPYKKFKENLKSNCELYGIVVEFPDEKYTSQTCFNCGIIRKANRVKRGLYRCIKCGIERNADINGAINILTKVAREDEIKHIQWGSCDIISPKRVKLVNFTS